MTGALSGDAQSAPQLSVFMDGLVNDARSARDQVFNTLDAVDRRTKLSSESMARQVQRFIAEQAAAARAERDPDRAARAERSEHDARFDPEDEWELRAPDAVAGGAAAAAGRPANPMAHDTADETADDDEYPDTWLR